MKKKTRQTITRKGTFDSGHRVLNERMKCFNLHGHTYLYELEFEFGSMKSIGYAIDFKEIKRVACQWIDDMLDHAYICNPQDKKLLKLCKKNEWKYWEMSLNGEGEYCNPTVENIAKELFLAVRWLFSDIKNLELCKVTLYETPNCFTKCKLKSISLEERNAFFKARFFDIRVYAENKGVIEYDDRKVTSV